MKRMECPVCRNILYSSASEAFSLCPYCGVSFSDRYGIEKRTDNRMRSDFTLNILHQGSALSVRALNTSGNGICIEIFGSPSLSIGDTVNINMGNYSVKARIMWTEYKRNALMTMAGCRLL